jgi:hypothetical protein
MPGKFSTRISWREKLNKPELPKIVRVPAKWQKHLGRGTMAFPQPLDVEALIRTVRRGELVT